MQLKKSDCESCFVSCRTAEARRAQSAVPDNMTTNATGTPCPFAPPAAERFLSSRKVSANRLKGKGNACKTFALLRRKGAASGPFGGFVGIDSVFLPDSYDFAENLLCNVQKNSFRNFFR